MGLSERLKDLTDELATKAQDAAATHQDQIRDAVQKAQTAADQRTGGQYREQITKAGAKVDRLVTDLAERAPGAPRAGDEPPTPNAGAEPPTPSAGAEPPVPPRPAP
jgi:DNA-binding protein H-NS